MRLATHKGGLIVPTSRALIAERGKNGVSVLPRKPVNSGLPVVKNRGGGIALPNFYPYPIDYSLRFRKAVNPRLERTFAAGNQTIWTVSFWVKRGGFVADAQHIFSAGGNHPSPAASMGFVNGSGGEQFGFIPNNGSSAAGYIETSPVFRDPAKHMHVVIAFNSTLATATDRVKFYFNRRRVTNFNTADWPALNGTTQFNSAVQHRIGHSGWVGQYLDGNISNFTFVGGQELQPEAFGELSNLIGDWIPKQYVPPIATNNCLLEFKDASAATAAAIGKDTSGNGNDWTPTNISVTSGVTFDQSTDTPTNSFATLNPLDKSSNITLSDTNLTVVATSEADYWIVRATMPVGEEAGGYYWEVTIGSYAYTQGIGLANGLRSTNGFSPTNSIQRFFEFGTNANVYQQDTSASVTWSGAPTFATGDTVAVFYRQGKLWFGRIPSGNSTITWINSSGTANPNTDTDPRWSGIPAGLFPAHRTPRNAPHHYNFGQRPFVATNIPTGALALNTKNLPNPAIRKSTEGFVTVLDTESNIDATLAAARSGFSSWVEITKNRTNAETWAWRFSHDSANEYAVSSTATRQAKRTNSGADLWVGYAINIGSTYGTAAGSVNHTNGAATTVDHNLARSRTAIFLFPRGGGDIHWLHPSLTAGSLLRLNTNEAQFASTIITGAGSHSFQIGSGVATGTYDYLVIGEVDGFSRLHTYSGNESADGPNTNLGFAPAFWLNKPSTSAGISFIRDAARQPNNLSGEQLSTWLVPMYSAGEGTQGASWNVDFLAGGFKNRSSVNGGMNASGQSYVGISFAGTPFKFATAR